MATFAPVTKYLGSTPYGLRISVSSVPDTLTNTSRVTVVVYLVHPGIDIKGRDASVTIDGASYKFTTKALDTDDSPLKVATKSRVVTHNDDGTREVVVSASFPYTLSSKNWGSIGTAKVSGKFTLDNIPRSSEIVSQTASVVANGTNEWSLKVSKHADAFRHKATLKFGSETYTTDVFDTDVSYAIPTKWLNQIPTATKGTASVSIQTYSDESCATTIGTPVTTSFEVSVPADAAPSVASGWARVDPYNTGTAAAALNVYVQGHSKARATFDTDKITKKYGATGITCRVEYDGATDASLTKVLTKTGTQRIYFRATDSRGLSTTGYQDITVHEYSKPTLSDIALYRCNDNGVADPAGTSLYFKATCNYSACGGANTVTMKAEWKTASAASWQNSSAITSGTGSVLGGGALSATTTYNARITATDKLGNSVTYTTAISTDAAAFNIKKGGKGAAFGKYAEYDNLLDSVWNIHSNGYIEAAGALKGASAAITGAVSAGSVTATGAVQGQTVKATGAVSGASVAATGAVTGASAAITGAATVGSLKSNGAVSGTTGTFTGGVSGEQNYRLDVVSHTELLADRIAAVGTFKVSTTAGQSPRISRVGPLVFMDGLAQAVSTITGGVNEVKMLTLPQWAWPNTTVYIIHQGSARRIFWLYISTTGEVVVTRIRDESGYTNSNADNIFPITACWIAADAFE